MALLKEIVYNNPAVRRIKDTIASLNININRTTHRHEQHSTRLTEVTSALEAEKPHAQSLIESSEQFPNLCECITNYVLRQEGEVIRLQNSVNNLSSALGQYRDTLNDTQQKLSELSSTSVVITKESLKRDLSSVESVNPRTIVVGEDTHGIFVRWRYDNIVMIPSENPFINLNEGQQIKIHMPPIITAFYLYSRKVIVTAPRNGKRHRGMNSNLVVHPHILSGNSPCLGDYQGPINEAIDDKDWQTLAGLMEMFLSGAANNDPAGKLWYRWLINNPDSGEFNRASKYLETTDSTFPILANHTLSSFHACYTYSNDADRNIGYTKYINVLDFEERLHRTVDPAAFTEEEEEESEEVLSLVDAIDQLFESGDNNDAVA